MGDEMKMRLVTFLTVLLFFATACSAGLSCEPELPGDLDGNCRVDSLDFVLLALRWLEEDCNEPDWCGGGDIDSSTVVDTADLAGLAEDWLRFTGHDGWRVMPIRSEVEFQQGKIGGEAEQHCHGIARSGSEPNIIYLSHDACQTWKSTDGGQTWHKSLGIGLYLTDGQSIEVDPVDPNIVFLIVAHSHNWLAENYEGIYRSRDGGDTWQLVLHSDTNFDSALHRIYRHNIAYDPSTATVSGASRWYVAFPNNALFRSDNSGDDWTFVAGLAGHSIVYAVQTHPDDGQTVYLASDQGLYVSSSQGTSIQPLGNLPAGAVSSVQVNPAEPNILYATVKNTGLYRSVDAGATFSLLRGFDAARVFMNPGYPDTLYLVGTSSNTIITHNAGTTWIEDMVTVPAPGLGRDGSDWKSRIAGEVSGIVPNPDDPDEAVAFSRATIWKTTDGGHTFVDSSTLFTGYSWGWWNHGAAFDRHDPNRFAFFNMDVGMSVTTTGSDYFDRRNDQAWQWYTQGFISWIGAYAGDIQPIPGSKVIVASIGNYFDTELMRTANEGLTWQLVTQDSEQNLFIAFHLDDPNIVYAGNKISHDAGQTFSRIDFGTFNGINPSILGMCLANPDTIYAMDSDRYRILRSDDRGTTWYLYTQPGWSFRRLDPLPTFAACPADCNKVYTLNGSYDLAVYDGSSWRSTGVLALASGSELNNFVRTVVIDPRHPEIIYAGTFSAGLPCIFRSIDAGFTWQDITYNLPRAGMSAMSVNPYTGELFRGGVYGTWVFPPPYVSDNLIYDKLDFGD